jgi:hypothetical protein
MTLSEPDVTLTDFGLALECAGFAAWLHRRYPGRTPLRAWFIVFFASLGFAALCGGMIHGFFPDARLPLYRLLWTATLLAIGATALSGWALAARLVLPQPAARHVTAFAGAVFATYSAVVMFVTQSFAIAIIHYLPAAAFLLAAFIILYLRRHADFVLTGIAGLILSFWAAWVQQGEISLHPVYFNHNALYHLIQAFALFLIFLTARGLLSRSLSEK